MIVIINAIISEVGVAYKMPLTPNNKGKINKKGITNITCLA